MMGDPTSGSAPSPRSRFYQTIPLTDASQSIRVLDISVATSGGDSPLIGKIRVVSLDLAPSYTALSYTWGPTSAPRYYLQCQPQEFDLELTANCYSALQHLRNRFGDITIWVDSICINQDDEDEKTSQIPLMNRIYAGCEQLYIWLGPGNGNSDKTMDYLALCAKMSARLPFDLVTSRDEWPRGLRATSACMWRARIRTLSEAFARLRIWVTHRWIARGVDLDEIFARDWIRRAWTYQEIILSPNPTIVCGNKILSWEDVATYLMFRHSWWSALTINSQDPLRLIGPVPAATATSLESWRTTIAMWLQFGSHSTDKDDGGETTRFVLGSNYEKLAALDEHNATARLLKTILGYVLLLATGVGWFWAALSLTASISIFLSLATWIFMLFPPALWVVWHGCWIVWHIVFGFRPGWYTSYYETSPNRALYLEGVRVALRERTATKPHDMVYSMLAVIGTTGLTDYDITYDQSPSQCFQHFLTSIVAAHPPALTMLCDAGITTTSPPRNGPSWVPYWANPHPNPAVSSQFSIHARSNPSAPIFFLTTAPYSIVNTTLHVASAIPIGRITFTTPPRPHPPNPESIKTHPIPGLMNWYRRIRTLHAQNKIWLPSLPSYPEDDTPFTSRLLPSAIFATLECLSRPHLIKVAYTVRLKPRRGRGGRRGGQRPDELRQREEWQAPIDFSDREMEWRDFKEFNTVLDEGTGGKPNSRAEWYAQRVVQAFVGERDRGFVVVEMDGVRPGGKSVIGTGPAAAEVGDWVYQLPEELPGRGVALV